MTTRYIRESEVMPEVMIRVGGAIFVRQKLDTEIDRYECKLGIGRGKRA